MHQLLQRQIEKYLSPGKYDSPEFSRFLDAVNEAYHQSDADYALMERASDLTSDELLQKNAKLLEEIAEREKAESQLKEYAEELEKSNADLHDFIHIISHDFKEPVRKIITFIDLLSSLASDWDENSLSYLDRIQRSANRLNSLMSDLVKFSQLTFLQTGEFEVLDLNHVVEEVIKDLEIQIQNSCGRVDLGPLPVLQANRFQMVLLLSNLISNALKYQRKGVPPHVRVTCPNLPQNEGIVELTVEDNGIGFEEKYCERIFKPFQRLHNRAEFEGTGFGLTLCKKIVDYHGGEIMAESEPGKGAKFMVKLPSHQN